MARKSAYQLDFGLLVLDPEAHLRQQQCRHRRCLSCSRDFPSTWAGNRICGPCKDLDSWSSPATSYTISCAF
jgi:hypothetical protein